MRWASYEKLSLLLLLLRNGREKRELSSELPSPPSPDPSSTFLFFRSDAFPLPVFPRVKS